MVVYNPSFDELRSLDVQRVRHDFYASLDESRLHSLLMAFDRGSIESLSTSLKLVGSGGDMEVWQVLQTSMPLALRLWHERYSTDVVFRQRMYRWLPAVQKLENLGLKMLPPLRVLKSAHCVALVTPLGSLDRDAISEQWRPLE